MPGTNQEIVVAGLNGVITDGWQYDDLTAISASGILVQLTSAAANGGLNASTPTNIEASDINSIVTKSRFGMITSSITTASSSRARLQQTNLTRYQISNKSVVGFGADVSFNGGQIDFANDPVFQIVGFANAGVSGNPTQGVYIRPPYVGETNFYKCVLTYFDSGTSTPVNVIMDTTVPYDSTANRFLNVFVLIDGTTDSVTYTIKYDGNTYTKTVNNVLATYPDMWSGSVVNSMTISVHRSGAPVVGVARSIIVDKTYRYIKPNYNY